MEYWRGKFRQWKRENNFMAGMGFEPLTSELQAQRSTALPTGLSSTYVGGEQLTALVSLLFFQKF